MNFRPFLTAPLSRPIVACAVLAAACASQTARADLVAYWPFDSSGTLSTDTANSNVLTVNGGATHTANGRNGGGLALNGTNQYLSGTVANLPIGDDSYTLAAWIKPTATGARGIVGWGNFGTTNTTNALRLDSSNGLVNYWWAVDLSTTVAANWSSGEWYHVAATYDGTTRRLFFNGVQVAQDTPADHAATAANFRIGSTNNGEYFQGTLDDVAIYDHALSVGEVASLAEGDTPQPPALSDITLTPAAIEENNIAGDTVGTLANVGGTGAFTFTLVSGAGATDNASFSIDGTDLNLNVAADYETKSSYSIRVRADNGAGETFEKALVISVTNVNEAPSLSVAKPSNAVAWWRGNGNANDSVSTNHGTLQGGAVHAAGRSGQAFSFNGSNGHVLVPHSSNLSFSGSFSIEAWVNVPDRNTHYMIVTKNPTAGGQHLPGNYELRINPTGNLDLGIETGGGLYIFRTSSGLVPTGQWVHVAATVDPAAGIQFFVNGVLSGSHSINIGTIPTNTNPVRIGARADGYYFKGLIDELALYNRVLSASEIQNIYASPSSAGFAIAENLPAGTAIGTFTGTDPDAGDTFSYSLVSGTGDNDNSSFTISGDQLLSNAVFDFETKSSFSIRVRITDNGTPAQYEEQVLTVNITDANDAPTFQTRQLLYETVTPTRNGSGQIVYSVNNSAALAALALQRVAYRMEVDVAGVPRYAEVSFDAWAGLTVAGLRVPVPSSPLVIQRNVTNLNVESNYPGVVNATGQTGRLEIWPWNYSQTANAGVGGNSSTYDFDDTHTGNASFGSFQVHNLSSTPKQTVLAWNQHSASTPDIGFGNNTGNANPDWTFMGANSLGKTNWKLQIFSDGSYFTLAENAATGTAAGTLVALDADSAGDITYSFASGDGDDDNGSFTLDGAVLRSAVSFDYEDQATRTVRVRATDSGGAYTEQAFTIIIQDLDDSPTDITLTPATVVENNAPGATVGTLAAVGGTGGYGFTLVSGTGDADNASYEIDGTALKILISADYEAGASHSIRVRADDGAGSFLEKALTITITNVPELQIAVFDGTVGGGAALTDNTGTVDYGDVVRGTSSAARLFTLHNPGDTTLTGISVAKAGTGTPGDFTLDTTSLAASLAPGQSTTFTVTFTPGTYGARTSRLDIASSDATRSPFEVHLTGASTATEALARTNLAMTPAEGLEDGGMLYRPLTGVINQDGRVTFRAFGKVGSGGIIAGNDSLLLSDASGSLQVVAREGAQAGATASHKFMGAFTHYLLTESGQTITLDRIRGASAATDYAYVASPDGVTLEMLSREGEAAPGGGNFKIHTAKPAADSLGRMYFSGDLTGASVTAKTDSGIWQEDSGTMRLLAREGADLSGLTGDAAWLGGVAAMVAAGGDGVAFIAQLQNNPENAKQRTLAARNAVVLAGNEDGMEVILRKGDTVPGTSGRVLNLLSGVSRSATGAHAVLGNLKAGSGVTATNNGVLVAVADGVPRLVARKGVTSIGGRPLARFIAFHAVGDDTVVFSTDSALCRWTVAGGLEELALKGQPAPGLGSNHAVISTLSVSPGGAIAVTTRLVDGRAVLWRALPGEALSQVVVSGEDILVEGVPVTILNLAVHDAGEGVGGGGGGMGSAINDSGHVFVNLSLGNGLHVARIYP